MSGVSRREVRVIRVGDHGIARDGYETIAVSLLGVFVDETAREDGCHFGVVQSGDFGEGASVCDASIFGHAYFGQLIFRGHRGRGIEGRWEEKVGRDTHKRGIPYPV